MTSPKEFLFEDEARSKLAEGIDQLAQAVGITLGPYGKNVALESSFGAPKITNDGNSIIDEIEVKDRFINMGISLGKQTASQIKDKCGDGTTTGIILLNSLIKSAIKTITAGTTPILLKRGIEKAAQQVLKNLDEMAISIKDDKDTYHIAKVSASGDSNVGKIIADAFKKVGKKGVISIEEGKGLETFCEIVEGMQLDQGYLSSYFVTDTEKMITEMDHPLILLTDKKISSIQEIIPILQSLSAKGKELLVVAEDIEKDVLSTLVINKLKGTLKVTAIKAPGFGDRRKAILEDLATLTGAVCISEEKGLSLKNISEDQLGSCEKVIITKEKTTLIKGNGASDAIETRIKELELQIENESSPYDKKKLQERKAKLKGGIALIQIGAHSEMEMKQKKQLFEDSLNATEAALEEGIASGGGIALFRASLQINTDKFSLEEKIGAKALTYACAAPLKQIIYNCGLDSSLILEDLKNQKNSFGFNATSEKVEDLLKAGIIDPIKVIKNSLIHAVSSAGILLLSEALITEVKED